MNNNTNPLNPITITETPEGTFARTDRRPGQVGHVIHMNPNYLVVQWSDGDGFAYSWKEVRRVF
jgi:hypothetical protein